MISRSTSRETARLLVETETVATPAPSRRTFALGIWALALGYFASYAPYTALVRITSTGTPPGIEGVDSRFGMLLGAGLATGIVTALIITALGWWRYAGRRVIGGTRLPCPTRRTLVAGLATVSIIYATTLMYTFSGVSILLAMLLMRAGVLMLAPAIDSLFKRRVRWFSWTALGLSLLALAAVAAELTTYHLTWALGVTVGVYVAAYAVRLHCINTVAKSDDRDATRRYFVEEQMVAMGTLIVVPVAVTLIGSSGLSVELRRVFASFVSTDKVGASLLIGVLYACLYWFGTSIYLDRRENTFCISLNRASSLLAGLVASYGIAFRFGERLPNVGELTGAALIAVAILVLSPLHHLRPRLSRFERPIERSPVGRPSSALAPAADLTAMQAAAELPIVSDGIAQPLSVNALER
jgi:hypothetical protein